MTCDPTRRRAILDGHRALLETFGELTYPAPHAPRCPRCGRETRPWPLRRPARCSPKEWLYCIRPRTPITKEPTP